MEKIGYLRTQIDQVNKELIILLIQRQQISKEIGIEKRRLQIPVFDPSREVDILSNIQKTNPQEYKYLKPIFEQIITQSRLIQN